METIIQKPFDPTAHFKQVICHPKYVNLWRKNIEIQRAYTNIVTDLRWLLARMNSEEHRTYLLSSYEVITKYEDNVLFEFTCIMCELRLSVKHYCYYLELDTDSDIYKIIGGYNYRKMLRSAYRLTNYECTNQDIEDCLSIETNMQNHYKYFKSRLKDANEENAMIAIEPPCSFE